MRLEIFNGRLGRSGARAAAALAFAAASAYARGAERDPYPDVRESMIAMSRQLGVTCVHCHDPADFKSNAKAQWKVAKQHMRIVEVLNGPQGFGGKPKADCYMCHRGAAAYPYKESVGSKAPLGRPGPEGGHDSRQAEPSAGRPPGHS